MEFEKTPINIKKTIMQGICYSVYKGENRVYGVLAEGGCATFIIINLDSEKIIFSQDAPGATGSWGVAVASDGRVYFGTYVNAGLYRFDPETEQL
ncbi:MAG: PQQ-binding-like beta-propeller repeat protein, partial [Clostridia bacterium]